MTTFTSDDKDRALDELYNEYHRVCNLYNQMKIELDFYKTRAMDLENEVNMLRKQHVR
jgi:hypothetical protein